VKVLYSLGQTVESGYLTANTFVFFYYTASSACRAALVGRPWPSAVLDAAPTRCRVCPTPSAPTGARRLPPMLWRAH
jgi:hypothetical protein